MEIIWSPQALEDIEITGDYIAKDSKQNSINFINELISSTENLITFPELGQLTPENPVYRQIIKQGYRLIYKLTVKQIFIITVLGPGQKII